MKGFYLPTLRKLPFPRRSRNSLETKHAYLGRLDDSSLHQFTAVYLVNTCQLRPRSLRTLARFKYCSIVVRCSTSKQR